MTITVKSGKGTYPVIFQSGALAQISTLFCLDRKVLVVTDSGVPEVYAKTVTHGCKEPVIVTINEGEQSKSLSVYEKLIDAMIEHDFTRRDCVVAVGGGVVGDLSGFAASSYMRGIDFYNVPTTVLAQVDSAVGGKVAVDYGGLKNIIGAFYPPKGVLIDVDLLSTLPARQVANGLSESVKMALTCDATLFDLFENSDISSQTEEIIRRSVMIKKSVVEQDETEQGIRKVLNFGHTVAHGIESDAGFGKWYHGECVAMGMLPMCAPSVRPRLCAVLHRIDLPDSISFNLENVLAAVRHDKKSEGDLINIVTVPEVGKFVFEKVTLTEIKRRMNEVFA